MDSFKTVLCKDSTIADITPELGYVVESGAAQTTYQQFPATAASSSNMIFNVQVPSENIVIGRDALIESQMGYNFSIGSADQPVTGCLHCRLGTRSCLERLSYEYVDEYRYRDHQYHFYFGES